MISKTRDYYIDNVRGLATISVIFIHTVFWSGSFYVPDFIRNASLFFDVPVFFLLTGFVFRSTGKIDSLRQSVKIVTYFLLFTLSINLLTFNFNLYQIIDSITFTAANIPAFPVVNGSFWFVPMYISSAIVAHALINSFGNKTIFIIPVAVFYYIFSYISGFKINNEMFGISVNSLLFYVALILTGYNFHGLIGKKITYVFLAISIALFAALTFHYENSIVLQKYKLNLSLPYVAASTISIALIFTGIFPHKKSLLSWVGQRAIFFYMAQGIGASVLYYIVHRLKIDWIPKLIIMFSINLLVTFIVAVVIVAVINKAKHITVQTMIKQEKAL